MFSHLKHLFPLLQEKGAGGPCLLDGEGAFKGSGARITFRGKTLFLNMDGNITLRVPYGREGGADDSDDAGEGMPEHETGWQISHDRNSLTYRGRHNQKTTLKLLKGFPLIPGAASPGIETLVKKYLGYFHNSLESWAEREHWQYLYEVENTARENFKGIFSGRLPYEGKKAITPGLEYLFLQNAITLLTEYGNADISALQNGLANLEPPPVLMPVLGDVLMRDSGPIVLYRLSRRASPDTFGKAEAVNREIQSVFKTDRKKFDAEKQRLFTLLKKLYGSPAADDSRKIPKDRGLVPKDQAEDAGGEDSGQMQAEAGLPKASGSRGRTNPPVGHQKGGKGFRRNPFRHFGSRKTGVGILLVILVLAGLFLAGRQFFTMERGAIIQEKSKGTESPDRPREAGSPGKTDAPEFPEKDFAGIVKADNVQTQLEPVVIVETERRPQSRAEALEYLKFEGMDISLADIHLVSNAIACKNGYRDLDYIMHEGENPDWIYPGNSLLMPEGSPYIVKKGDSIWFIASRLIRRELERDLARLAELEALMKQPGPDKTALGKELLKMSEKSNSEALRRKIQALLEDRDF